MTDPLFDTSDGDTPIDDEADGLRLSWVRTRGDLNEAEAANILEARRAVRSPSLDDVLDDLWLRRLHERMFGDVWPWAGTYRRSGRNIGILRALRIADRNPEDLDPLIDFMWS